MQKSLLYLRTVLLTGACFVGLGAHAFGTTVSFTTSVTPNSGKPGVFSLPYTALDGSAALGSSFIAGSFKTSPSNASVTSNNLQLTVTPTIAGTSFNPLTFYASITNPAANTYCLDFATAAAGPFNAGLNCQTSNPNTAVLETFDNSLYEVFVSTYTLINSPTKTTNLVMSFAAVPEPASVATSAVGALAMAALLLRRKAAARRSLTK